MTVIVFFIIWIADMYDAFIEANRYPDEDKRKLKIKRLLHLLPAHHNETLKRMAEHLNKVASYGHINKVRYIATTRLCA